MGFLDRLIDDSRHFKTAKNGRKLYFPFPLGRGYIVPSDVEFQRLRKKLKISSVYILIYIIAVCWLPHYSFLAALLFAGLGYAFWSYSQCRHLERSEEYKENFARRAREASFLALWFLEICMIALVAAGILIIIRDWEYRHIGSSMSIIFGFGTFIVAKTLMAKRRLGQGNSCRKAYPEG